VRKYDSALHAALAGYNIPVAVFENLVRTVGEHLEPLHRYGRLRKRALKLDLLHAYDLAAPLVPEAEMTFSYEEATKLVREGLAPMGPEYGALLDRAFREGWIDVHESEGKRSGAYSTGTYGTSPYILLNFNGTLDAVFTLAHELGHSLHTYYAQSTQPFVYSDYAIFVAEVASTCAESLLMAHLLEQTTDRDRRLYLLNHWVEGIRGTFYTQVMFAEFEWEIHKRAEADEPLTHESLSAIFADLFARYYGPELVHDRLNDYGWSRIPHFYYNFYVYQYATGYAAASALAQRIRKEGAQALEPYLEFLKSGSSAYPIELLERAGVDMTQPQPVVDTISLFDGLLGKMEELLPDAS
jgi:oligoendopeptidase F